MVVIEHDMAFVRLIAHKVTVLHQGKLLAEGSMDAGAERRAGHRCLSGTLSESADAERDRTQRLLRREPRRPRRLASRCGDGETLAIMGRNGMGKTTLLKSLIGLLPARSGTVTLSRARR